jgi:hypothetical protein
MGRSYPAPTPAGQQNHQVPSPREPRYLAAKTRRASARSCFRELGPLADSREGSDRSRVAPTDPREARRAVQAPYPPDIRQRDGDHAVFIALGGSSYAAITVTGKNVKNSSLTGKDIKNNSVTGKDVKGISSGDVTDGSLLSKDFKAGQLPTGPKGDRGLPGSDAFGALSYREATTSGNPNSYGNVACPAGQVPTGGGARANVLGTEIVGSSLYPVSGAPTGWEAYIHGSDGVVYVICARAGSVDRQP